MVCWRETEWSASAPLLWAGFIAVRLVFVGVKMLIVDFYKVSIIALGVVAVIVAASVVASIVATRRNEAGPLSPCEGNALTCPVGKDADLPTIERQGIAIDDRPNCESPPGSGGGGWHIIRQPCFVPRHEPASPQHRPAADRRPAGDV